MTDTLILLQQLLDRKILRHVDVDCPSSLSSFTITPQTQVEHIIREDFSSEALEIIELYCELLLARFGLLEQLK